jgi:hypothetical protein
LQRAAQRVFSKTPRGKVIRLKMAAQKRGLLVTISANEFEKWWQITPHICEYCGRTTADYRTTAKSLLNYQGKKRLLNALKRKLLKLKQSTDYDLTIDRADNEQGYELTNLTKACWICNLVKGHFLTSKEMKFIAPRLRQEIEAGLAEI